MTKVLNLFAALAVASFLGGTAAAFDNPPSEFDHPANNMRVWHYSPAKANDLCGRLLRHGNNPYRLAASDGSAVEACAIGGPAQCILIMPQRSSITAAKYDRLYRHEVGHCNGWRH